MRKVICTFLTMFLAVPCMANIHINPDVVLEVIKKHVSSDKVNDTVREYNTQLKASNGTGISASKLWNVCVAAGWDVKQAADKKKCQSFVDDLVKSSTIKYFTVCTEEGKAKAKEAGGNPLCVDNVFYKLINGIDVQMEGAIQLSQEYAKVKYKDDNVICSKKERPDGPNDYVKCTSKEKNHFYEFKFDDVKQRTDKETYKDIVRGVGYIHGVEFKDSGCSLERIKHDTTCAVGYKTADKSLCAKLSDSLKRFDMKASVYGVSRSSNEQFCFVNEQAKECSNDKYGLNSDAFTEVQYPYTPELKQYIKSYVTTQAKAKGKSVNSFECAGAYQPHYKYVQGMAVVDGNDLNCSVNGDNVCFKFADLSEGADYSKNAGLSRLACIQYGGRVDDKNCRGLDEDFCINKLSPKLKEKGLSGAHYDRVRGGCILDAAVTERNRNLLGEIMAGIALTVVTDGAATIPVLISVGTDLAFEAVTDWQRKIPYKDYKDFMSAFNKCTIDVNNFDFKIKQTIETKYCLSEVLQKNYKLVVGQMDLLAPEDQKILTSVFANITENLGEAEYIRRAAESDISVAKSARNYAGLSLLAGSFFFNPKKVISQFDNVTRDIARLRYRVDQNFTKHLDDFKQSGHSTWMLKEALSKQEWEMLNKSLANEGIELFEKDGFILFRRLNKSIAQKYTSMQEVKNINFDELMKNAVFDQHYNDYMRSDLIDNAKFFDKFNSNLNKEIMRIGNTPVRIVDSGADSHRAIVIVEVGERRIPFYVSTGGGGKLNVPTGKWEVFFGLGDAKGWFNKGGKGLSQSQQLDRINRHYDSNELRQIADRLNNILGDPRNRLHINASKNRATSGGIGLVGDIDNMPSISKNNVNSCFKYRPENSPGDNLENNIRDISNYLRSLR